MIGLAIFLSILSMLMWAASDFLTKFLVDLHDHRVALFLVQFFAVACALLLLPATLSGGIPTGPALTRFIAFSSISAAASAAAWVFFYKGVREGLLSVSQPISSLWVVITVSLSFVFFGERLGLRVVAGMALSVAGIVLISLPASGDLKKMKTDAVYGLLAMGAWGVGMFFLKPAILDGGPLLSTVFVRAMEFLFLLPVCLPHVIAARRKYAFGARRIFLLSGAIGALNTVAFVVYNKAVSQVGLSVPSVIISGSPAAVVALAYLFHKERLSARQAVGVALAVAGLVLVSL